MPNNQIAPHLAKKGIRMEQVPAMDLTFNYFNMEDPVVGGYTPEKIALRRAIALGYKTATRSRSCARARPSPRSRRTAPASRAGTRASAPASGEYSVPKAKALLDMFGYVDRDGDGYRELPDGSPLVLKANSTPTARDQQQDELWKRSMDDIGIRITFRKAKWPDLLKEAYLGKLAVLAARRQRPRRPTPTPGSPRSTARTRREGQHGALPASRVRPALRAGQADARQPRAHEALPADGEDRRGLRPWKVNVHRVLTDMCIRG
jgi:ABC-type transport system substrate-binding protein